MYKKFYGLTRNPFEISPDPYFWLPTSQHNEALACVFHGVLNRKGFIVVAGEVGTGKTLLVRCLLERLYQQQVATANVFNPCLSVLEFLRYIAGDLGFKSSQWDKGTILLELNNYLIARHKRGETTVLVVDEAQHLSLELMEEIRLLTNLETSQQKLLQIVLVGQPELDRKMDSPELRQLKQRIALRCQLGPLDEAETRDYILRRLERSGAGGRADALFPPATMDAVFRQSRGIPRLINTICENALIASFAERAPVVQPEIVAEVARDLRLDVSTATYRSSSEPVIARKDLTTSLLQFIEAVHRISLEDEPRSVHPQSQVKTA